jgi:hypothetical protein
MSEKDFRKKCCKIWKDQGAFIFPNVAFGTHSTPGWPDLYVSHPLWQGWIEMKGRTTKLSKAQELVLRRLHAQRHYQGIVYRDPCMMEVCLPSGIRGQSVQPEELLQWLGNISSSSNAGAR